jgi:hypothetical protein
MIAVPMVAGTGRRGAVDQYQKDQADPVHRLLNAGRVLIDPLKVVDSNSGFFFLAN